MSLRHALLGLINQGPASGYDLTKRFQLSLANVWPATQSQIYTELGKLTEQGLLLVTEGGQRGRKEYEITDAGQAELRHWVLEVRPTPVRRSDALLRVFFLDVATPDEAVAYLRSRVAVAAAEGSMLGQQVDTIPWGDDPLSTYGRLVLEYGLRFAEMRREWAEWAADYLRQTT